MFLAKQRNTMFGLGAIITKTIRLDVKQGAVMQPKHLYCEMNSHTWDKLYLNKFNWCQFVVKNSNLKIVLEIQSEAHLTVLCFSPNWTKYMD